MRIFIAWLREGKEGTLTLLVLTDIFETQTAQIWFL